MAIDATILSELDADVGIQIRSNQQGHQHAMERLRSTFDQNGHAVNAAIASVMLQASLPEQAMSSKLADRTPSSPAQPDPPNPTAAPPQINTGKL